MGEVSQFEYRLVPSSMGPMARRPGTFVPKLPGFLSTIPIRVINKVAQTSRDIRRSTN
jgi:hypothetical protein